MLCFLGDGFSFFKVMISISLSLFGLASVIFAFCWHHIKLVLVLVSINLEYWRVRYPASTVASPGTDAKSIFPSTNSRVNEQRMEEREGMLKHFREKVNLAPK